MSQVADLMFEANVRCEQVIYIPGAVLIEEGFPDAFSESFVENLPEDSTDALYTALPVLRPFVNGDEYPEAWQVAEALRYTPGFLVEAATPVQRPYGKASVYSWGHYHTAWLYAPSEDQIAPVIAAWAEARHTADAAPKEEATQ